MVETLQCPNRELDIFAHARNWKAYWRQSIEPFIAGSVLEVGAGIGANTELLSAIRRDRWVCLEPDPPSADRIRERVANADLADRCEVVTGTLESIARGNTFDTVIYIDVLEHIEHDREELRNAARLMNPSGHLIVLCPAHQRLYTEFDRAIGHYRRYSRKQLVAAGPPDLRLRSAFYLDSVGMLLSLGNRMLLKQDMPALRQIQFWDRVIVPISRLIDPVLRRNAGKSVVAVWQRV